MASQKEATERQTSPSIKPRLKAKTEAEWRYRSFYKGVPIFEEGRKLSNAQLDRRHSLGDRAKAENLSPAEIQMEVAALRELEDKENSQKEADKEVKRMLRESDPNVQ